MVMVLFLIAFSALILWLNLVLGAAALIAGSLVFLYYKRLCDRQFGGVTGDLAGYFLQVCELAMLTGIVLAGGLL